jgi:glycosyltransferase involved in cell wall biosynthesis
VVCNDLAYLLNFRRQLIEELLARGHAVTVAGPPGPLAAEVKALGVDFEPWIMTKAGRNPLAEAAVFLRLLRIVRRVRPDALFAYAIKPVIWGMLAGALGRARRRVALITGLGYAFIEGPGLRRRLTRWAASAAYRVAFGCAHRVVFQNGDDEAYMTSHGILGRPAKAARVDGSGVDLEAYPARPLPPGPPVFLMIARLLKDKGAAEFVEAARRVRAALPEARFVLAGGSDPNPAAVPAETVDLWRAEGLVELPGHVADVRPLLQACSVFVLPSYREGTPRTGLEALATGRPVIVTDVPGCREVALAGENGWLVPARDAAALAEAMLAAASDPARLAAMGVRSRALAEARYEGRAVARRLADLTLDEEGSG